MRDNSEIKNQQQAIMTAVIVGVVIILGITIFYYLGQIAADPETISTNESYVSTPPLTHTLSPNGEGISSSELRVYNNTWLNFDGLNDYVNIINKTFTYGLQEMTMCIEFTTKNFTAPNQYGLISNRLQNNDRNWTQLTIKTDGTLDFICKNQSTESTVLNGEGGIRTSNYPYLVCGGYNETAIVSYFQGYVSKINSSRTTNSDICTGNINYLYNMTIGGYYNLSVPVRLLNGTINNVFIYNRSLNMTEMQSIYTSSSITGYSQTSNITLLNWINSTSTILISANVSQFDNSIREQGNILFNATGNGLYITTYTGFNGSYAENNTCIGWANSTDGINWNKQGKLISCGGSTNSVFNASEDPYLIYNGSTYLLYVEDKQSNPFANISLFTSTDLTNWNSIGVILKPNVSSGWGINDVSSPVVFIEDNIYYMFYEGRGGNASTGEMGLANSTDGINWNIIQSPIVRRNSGWSQGSIVPDDIYKVNDVYYLLVHGYNINQGWSTGIVTTTDIFNSSKYNIYKRESSKKDSSAAFFKDGTNKIIETTNNANTINLSYFGYYILETVSKSTDGLILDYRLNENNGTIAYDSSSNGNNGTISGATWANDNILVTLSPLIDYTLNSATGVLTLTSPYIYSWIYASWTYIVNQGSTAGQEASQDLIESLSSGATWLSIFIIASFAAVVLSLFKQINPNSEVSYY